MGGLGLLDGWQMITQARAELRHAGALHRLAFRPSSAMPSESVARRSLVCSLNGDDYRNRIAWPEDLTRRALRGHRRDDLTLHLIYALRSRCRRAPDGRARTSLLRVPDFRFAPGTGCNDTVTITAPEAVRDSADMLFAPFLREPIFARRLEELNPAARVQRVAASQCAGVGDPTIIEPIKTV